MVQNHSVFLLYRCIISIIFFIIKNKKQDEVSILTFRFNTDSYLFRRLQFSKHSESGRWNNRNRSERIIS